MKWYRDQQITTGKTGAGQCMAQQPSQVTSDIPVSPVFQFMKHCLVTGAFFESDQGCSSLDLNPSPEQLAHGIVGIFESGIREIILT